MRQGRCGRGRKHRNPARLRLDAVRSGQSRRNPQRSAAIRAQGLGHQPAGYHRSRPRAGPALDPPGVFDRTHGLRVMPVNGLSPTPLQPNSLVVDLPRLIAPAARKRATKGASTSHGHEATASPAQSAPDCPRRSVCGRPNCARENHGITGRFGHRPSRRWPLRQLSHDRRWVLKVADVAQIKWHLIHRQALGVHM